MRSISIRSRLGTALLTVFAFALVAAALSVGGLAFVSARASAGDAVHTLGARGATEVAARLAERFEASAGVNALLAAAHRRGELPLERVDELLPVLWDLHTSFPGLDALYVGARDGTFAGYSREGETTQAMLAGGDGAPILFFDVDGRGQPVAFTSSAAGFAATGRSWYLDGIASPSHVFGRVFSSPGDPDRVALPRSLALRDASGEVQGVAASHFFLRPSLDAIESLSSDAVMSGALLHDDGRLITSAALPPAVVADLRAAARGGRPFWQAAEVELGGRTFVVRRHALESRLGEGWSVLVLLDHERAFAPVRAHERTAALLAGAMLLLLAGAALVSVRALTGPLQRLERAARDVHAAHPESLEVFERELEGIARSPVLVEEVARLAATMRAFAARLIADTDRLRDEARAHAQSAAEARMLAAVARATDEGVIITDASGRVEWVNPAFTRDLGFELEDMRGKAPGELLQGPGTDPGVVRDLGEAVREGRSVRRAILNHTKAGEPIFLDLTINPVFDAEGRLTRFVGVQRNITEARRRENELARWKDVFSHARWGVAVSAPEAPDRVGEVNPSLERLAGRPASALVEAGFEGLLGAEDGERVGQALRSEEDLTFETTVTRPEGDTVPVLFGLTAVRDEGGRVLRRFAMMSDLSELCSLRQEVRQARRMDALGRLAGGVAHDFNNTLAVIQGNAQVLREEAAAGEDTEIVEEILDACDRGRNLTGRLLRFSRGDDQGVQPGDLSAIVENFLPLLAKTLTPANHVRLEASSGSVPVQVNRADLEDALLNMAINAMHAMPRGGEVVIRTSLEEVDAARAAAWEVRAGPHARLDFEDDGEGMPPEVADRVFEPFFSTKGKDGTGLGMSEVYAMVRRRGGFMRCESQLGAGTRFQIFLPSTQLEVRPEAPASRAEPASPPAGGEGRILVVDDDPLVARTAARVLGREGYVVEQASTGEEALERVLSAGGIDAVVSDVVMPGMGGVALRQALRERAPAVPVLLVSGFSDRSAREHAGVDILRKPYAPTELLRRVAELLARQDASTSSDCPEAEPRTPGEGPKSPSVSEEARNCP